jgi:hypothetical protein
MATLPGAPRVNEFYETKPKFPLPPSTGNFTTNFPSDLVTNERNFYTQIQFVEYQRFSVFAAPFLKPLGGISLPLPKKINDVQTVVWESIEGGTAAAFVEGYSDSGGNLITAAQNGIATGALNASSNILAGVAGRNNVANIAQITGLSNAGAVLSAVTGFAVNPFLTMLFKQGSFKEHTLNWTFTPNSQEESNTLSAIINYFKFNMLPAYGGAVLKYPNILLVKFLPHDEFTFQFKPCAVSAISVDYSGGGGPSFFRNGAPTVVNVAVQLKEIELWTQNDYSMGF